MRIIYGEDERCLRWASERLGGIEFRYDAKAIGSERRGELVAVCVFDTFSANDCQMHIASDGSRRWLTREFLVHAFAFPFIQCNLNRVTGMVAANNNDAIRFDERLGFRREGYHPLAGSNGEDIISFGLLRRDCRFIPEIYRT